MTDGGSPAAPARDRPNRLVRAPVFVLCSIRSGSTLLRVMLNSHPRICAPHELHLRTLRVQVPKALGQPAMAQLGLDQRELEHLLWDRLLHLELERSGKSVVVDKTPANAFMWERIVECWPHARLVLLLRHPAAIVDSLARARPELARDRVEREVLGYARGVSAARSHLLCHTVRYEDLVAAPERVLGGLCGFLGVRYDPSMIAYGQFDHGPMRAGIGDWSEQIQSGAIQPARPLPSTPLSSPELRDLVDAWGYSADGAAHAFPDES